ncbi:Kdo hydroxylase family protein [Candidatus Palauibacter sp.]|uniref:Kdo hydroxylase family protein n=1 Tax=Candidatus Palauibacter sp. TaxID=3101350 RepID=UPI003B520806
MTEAGPGRGPRPDLADALERGEIVFFPACPVELPPDRDLERLRAELPRQLKAKNVSFHPEGGRLRGVRGHGGLRDAVRATLTAHGASVRAFLRDCLPGLTAGWTVGTTSFRPIQERGRGLSAHASNELIHFDAGAYGATDGDRILRFFVNVNPEEDRVWCTKGTFPDVFARYGAEAGVAGGGPLERGARDRLRGRLLKGIAKAGLGEAVLADSSPYDRRMRRFHNYMKDTPSFQERDETWREIRFPPFSAWMVLTDMVSHASVSGRHALVDTFILRLAACRRPELAPINILRGRAGSGPGARG